MARLDSFHTELNLTSIYSRIYFFALMFLPALLTRKKIPLSSNVSLLLLLAYSNA